MKPATTEQSRRTAAKERALPVWMGEKRTIKKFSHQFMLRSVSGASAEMKLPLLAWASDAKLKAQWSDRLGALEQMLVLAMQKCGNLPDSYQRS